MFFSALTISTLALFAYGQQPDVKKDDYLSLSYSDCTSTGCTKKSGSAVLDQNWRWIHVNDSTSGNCFPTDSFAKENCGGNADSCAKTCKLGALTKGDHTGKYGISEITDEDQAKGLQLKFKTNTNYGSRVYLLDDNEEEYRIFKLLNKEFTFTVDSSHVTCALNGAAYFVEMDPKGDKGKGNNNAGAAFGTGYCDAQGIKGDAKFIKGKANFGDSGAFCAEFDLWEANKVSTAFTSHPCKKQGLFECKQEGSCGWTHETRYDGECDMDGCDYNAYREGNTKFYGPGSDYTIDSTKPITVTTQFITDDGTDTGTLVEIKRIYSQNGVIIPNNNGDSLTEASCSADKVKFHNQNDHKAKGGLKSMGEALQRGMVFVMSIWDDEATHMKWLDSVEGTGVGSVRGTCPHDPSEDPRQTNPDGNVKFSNVKFGPINSTLTGSVVDPIDHAHTTDSVGPTKHTDHAHTTDTVGPTKHTDHTDGETVTVTKTIYSCATGTTPDASCAKLYGDCSGKRGSPTCCQEGSTCQYRSFWYSQCL